SPYLIYLCGAGLSAPASGTDSKPGTIIHELSHFTVIGGTDDHAYGQSGAQSLATSNPSNAILNADSYEYFAENTPALTNGDGSETTTTTTTLSAPTGFSASASGSTVTISWTAGTGASGYKVYYGTSSGTYLNASTGISLGNRTSYTFTNIPSGTYYLALKAYDSSGNLSSYSSEASVTVSGSSGVVCSSTCYTSYVFTGYYYCTDSSSTLQYFNNSSCSGSSPCTSSQMSGGSCSWYSSLSAPTGFSASASGSTVTISWSAGTGASGYKIYYGTSSGTYLNASSGVNLGNRTSFTFNNIPAGTYYLALKSYDSSGNLSSYSSEASVTVSSSSSSVCSSSSTCNSSVIYSGYYWCSDTAGDLQYFTNSSCSGNSYCASSQMYYGTCSW
ncbi:MAG: hypothetical protein HQK84_06745, partial [Nitrospinae bacterium]|nr:hypothetical protein [Nitrospinota bacterium]